MQTELLSISKIFTENLFRIPDYQRGYSWTEKQLKDFWNDIEQLEPAKNHYTGVLTFEQVLQSSYNRWDDDHWIINSKRFAPFYVVDGQQRLTTIIILLQALLENLPENASLNFTSKEDIRKKFIFDSKDGGISRSYIFGYEKDNPSYEFLKIRILLERSDDHSTAEETIYTHNLAAAKSFFGSKFENTTLDKLESIYTIVTQHLLFNIYTISQEIDVFVAFETMNNRGKPLSYLELLKNRLIFLSTKFQVDQTEKNQLRRVINECWKTIYHYLGKNKERRLSDDYFLRTHFFSYFGAILFADLEKNESYVMRQYGRGDNYNECLLEEIFTVRGLTDPEHAKKHPLSVNAIYAYAHDIKEYVQVFFNIFNPQFGDFGEQEKMLLERLWRLGAQGSSLLVMALETKVKDPDNRIKALKLLEQLRFLHGIAPYISGLENLDYNLLGARLANAKMTFEEAYAALAKYQGALLGRINFSSALMNWTKREGYYGWDHIRYFMFEYEQELKATSKTKRDKLTWEEFAKENYEEDYATTEHIYPQKSDLACWRDAFRKYSVKERNILKNSIGNLVPLSKPKNSSLRNKCFVDKKENSVNTVGYIYGCYSENEVALSSQWTGKEILERGIKLLDFMERRWGISIGDTSAKIKALGLRFVLPKETNTPAR